MKSECLSVFRIMMYIPTSEVACFYLVKIASNVGLSLLDMHKYDKNSTLAKHILRCLTCNFVILFILLIMHTCDTK